MFGSESDISKTKEAAQNTDQHQQYLYDFVQTNATNL